MVSLVFFYFSISRKLQPALQLCFRKSKIPRGLLYYINLIFIVDVRRVVIWRRGSYHYYNATRMTCHARKTILRWDLNSFNQSIQPGTPLPPNISTQNDVTWFRKFTTVILYYGFWSFVRPDVTVSSCLFVKYQTVQVRWTPVYI